MKYLVYYVMKPSDPFFTNNFEEWKETADNCYAVIVDLTDRSRYWNGEWRECPVSSKQK